MNKKLKKEWIKALRSNKYKQGMGVLKSRGNFYCCLGVLCDISKDIKWSKKTCGPGIGARFNGKITYGTLASEFVKKIKLDPHQTGRLIQKNDSGQSFLKIAKYVENNL